MAGDSKAAMTDRLLKYLRRYSRRGRRGSGKAEACSDVIVAVEFWRRSAACLHGRVVFRHRKPSWRNVACHEAIQPSKSTGDQVVSALGTSRPPRRSCSFAHGPAGLVIEHSVRETGITTRGCWLIKYGLNQFFSTERTVLGKCRLLGNCLPIACGCVIIARMMSEQCSRFLAIQK